MDERGKGYPILPSIFLSQLSRNFVGEPFSFSEKIWYGKVIQFRARFCFSVEDFRLTVPKNFDRETFCAQRTSALDCHYGQQGVIPLLRRDVLLSHSAKNLRGNHSVLQKPFTIERKLWTRRWISQFSVKNFSSHCAEKLRKENLLCSEFFWIRKKTYG